MSKIIVLVGSLRADSANRKVAELLPGLAPAGVTVELATGLGEVPFYNEDLDGPEAGGAPEAAGRLRAQVADATHVLIVTPEYNATMPAVLNNAIDWTSRPYGAGAIKDKPVAVIGVTPTPYGGKWAHEDTRKSVKIAGGYVVEDVDLSQSILEIDPLTDEGFHAKLREVLEVLVEADPETAAA